MVTEGRAWLQRPAPRRHRRAEGHGGAPGRGGGGRGRQGPGRGHAPEVCRAGGSPAAGGESPGPRGELPRQGRGRADHAPLRRRRGSPGRGQHHPHPGQCGHELLKKLFKYLVRTEK